MNDPLVNRLPAGKAADQKYCHSCGQVLHISAPSCTHCGALQGSGGAMVPVHPAASPQQAASGATQTSLPPNHVYCRGCGAGIHESAPSCPKCGAPQRAVSASGGVVGSKSRVTAGVLALFIGGLGAHKFYLGSIFLGLLYLVFFWTFIPAFVALIEGIYYLTLSDEEFARKYG